ncbi:MAG: SDR family NAD(P)-dependent oxidoreductase [Pseudomonadota bacterium]
MRLLLGIILFYGRFGLSFTAIGYLVRRLFWRTDGDRLDGKRVLVTGASGGIGAATVAGCQAAGAKVTAVARDAEKLAGLNASLPQSVTTEVVDLAEPADIDALLDRLDAAGETIDVLVNNVGVMLHEHARNSAGLDKQFAVNLLNQFRLTERAIARGLLADDAIIITVASGGMYMAPLVIAALATDDADAHDGQTAYAVQKRAQVTLNAHWQAAHPGRSFYVMHPGWVDTAGVKRSLPTFRRLLSPVLRNAEQGADTIVWLARQRPEDDGASIWFDRKPRKTHAYGFTRERSQPTDALVEFLEQQLAANDATSG